MTDIDSLKEAIRRSGISLTFLAQKTGVSRETLYNRFQSGDFKLSEIEAITKALQLTREQRDEIFFSQAGECDSLLA